LLLEARAVLTGIRPQSGSTAERFFMGIKEGDTPETNPASRLMLEWIDELQLLVSSKKRRFVLNVC
jgi:hypothetical protein